MDQSDQPVGVASQVSSHVGARPSRQQARVLPVVLGDGDGAAQQALGGFEFAFADGDDIVGQQRLALQGIRHVFSLGQPPHALAGAGGVERVG